MEQCVYCQAPLAPGEHVCQNCGRMQPLAELERPTMAGSSLGTLSAAPCPRCGMLVSAGESVCQHCGLTLSPAANQATRAASGTGSSFPPPPAPAGSGPGWGPGRQPGSGPGWAQGGVPGTPLPPAWPQAAPYQPGMTDPLGNQPTFSGPPTGWQQGVAPYQPPRAPGVFTAPPPGMSGPAAPRRSRRPLVIVGIVLALLVILGASGAAAYILTRPKPTLSVSGPTQSGANPAGAPDMAFHVVGANFSATSAITFFLDGQSLQGEPAVQSDGSGAFTVDLAITDSWLIGQHTLGAKDTKDYGPKDPVTVVVLAAPVLMVTSQYQQGNTPVGTQGTTLALAGKRFALSSPVTLLLDGAPLAGQPPLTSDDHGKVQAQVSVGKEWAAGNHTLTARDSQGNVTKSGAAVVIVAAGVAGTPGPNGAPADNASFTLLAQVSAKDSAGADASFQQSLSITGNPDPAGGSVCSADDDGQPHTFTGSLSGGLTFTETIVFSCTGSYKGGHLTYTETAVSDKITVSDGSTCAAQGAYLYGQFDGTFTDANTISGNYHRALFNAPCKSTRFSSLFRNSAQGTWTGSR